MSRRNPRRRPMVDLVQLIRDNRRRLRRTRGSRRANRTQNIWQRHDIPLPMLPMTMSWTSLDMMDADEHSSNDEMPHVVEPSSANVNVAVPPMLVLAEDQNNTNDHGNDTVEPPNRVPPNQQQENVVAITIENFAQEVQRNEPPPQRDERQRDEPQRDEPQRDERQRDERQRDEPQHDERQRDEPQHDERQRAQPPRGNNSLFNTDVLAGGDGPHNSSSMVIQISIIDPDFTEDED